MVAEIRRRTGIHEKHICLPRCKLRAVIYEIMHLLHAVWALITRKTTQYHEHSYSLRAFPWRG